jgi:hypothetical protein
LPTKAMVRTRPLRTSATATKRILPADEPDDRLATRAIVCLRTRFDVRTRPSARRRAVPLCAESAPGGDARRGDREGSTRFCGDNTGGFAGRRTQGSEASRAQVCVGTSTGSGSLASHAPLTTQSPLPALPSVGSGRCRYRAPPRHRRARARGFIQRAMPMRGQELLGHRSDAASLRYRHRQYCPSADVSSPSLVGPCEHPSV